MSFRLMAWASRQQTGNTTRKAVLLMLADRANDDTGRCDPSIKRLAADVEANPSTVRRALAALVDAGLIEVVHRKRDDGGNLPNHYRFPEHAWSERNEQRGSHDASTPGGATPGGDGGVMPPEPGINPNQEVEPGTLPAAPEPYIPRKGVRVRVEGEARPQDLVWNALAEAIDTTESPHGSRMRGAVERVRESIWRYVSKGDTLALLERVAADPEGYERAAAETVALVARRIRERHPGLTWGPEGIARHFDQGLTQADSARSTQAIVEEVQRESAG